MFEFIWPFVSVFIAMAVLDFIYAEYVKATSDRRPILSSFTASGLILVTGYVTTSYVKDPTLLIPAAIGAFVGTWISVKLLK